MLAWLIQSAAIAGAAELVRLAAGRSLFATGEAIEAIWFPETALIVLSAYSEDGLTVDTGLVGCEGAAGLVECLGDMMAAANAKVLLAGEAWKVRAEAVRVAVGGDPATFRLICRNQALAVAEVRRALLCQAAHQGAGRLAYVLLRCADYAGSDEALLTHDSLASLVGLRRTTVTALLGEMAERGLVQGRRGRILLVDRPGLEQLACACRREADAPGARAERACQDHVAHG